MLTYHISLFGFIMILNHDDMIKNKIVINEDNIEKESFIRLIQIFLKEIKSNYNFIFTDKKINIKATKCTNGCVAILNYKNIYELTESKSCKYKIKQPCPSFSDFRYKTVVQFDNADTLIDCLYALNHTMLRLKIPFDKIKNCIYLKEYNFILLIEKSPNIFSCMPEICREYGKVLRYNERIFKDLSLLNIKQPIKKLGNY